MMHFEVEKAIRQIFPCHVHGTATAVSEFGVTYQTWCLGGIREEGDTVPVWPVSDVTGEAVINNVASWFGDRRKERWQVIVWRETPDVRVLPASPANGRFNLPALPERWQVYMRFHFMRWEDYRQHVEGAL